MASNSSRRSEWDDSDEDEGAPHGHVPCAVRRGGAGGSSSVAFQPDAAQGEAQGAAQGAGADGLNVADAEMRRRLFEAQRKAKQGVFHQAWLAKRGTGDEDLDGPVDGNSARSMETGDGSDTEEEERKEAAAMRGRGSDISMPAAQS